MRFDLRFWAENISPPEIVKNGLELLEEFSAGVGVAMFADSMTARNAKAFRKLKEAGIELMFWPLLPVEKGYFPGEKNVPEFVEFSRELVLWAEANDVAPDMIAIDQELPFGQMGEILEANPAGRVLKSLRVSFSNLDRKSFQKAKTELLSFNAWARENGMRTLSACFPWVCLELEGKRDMLQDMMETPLRGIGWDIISPMSYASMIAGMSNGLITYKDANWLTYELCLGLKSSHPAQAGISLGVTGTGVLGNEPTFDSPEELLVGVEAALSAGVRDISIYSLEGTLARPDARRWFEMLRNASPKAPESSRKVRLGLAVARTAYPPLAWVIERFS